MLIGEWQDAGTVTVLGEGGGGEITPEIIQEIIDGVVAALIASPTPIPANMVLLNGEPAEPADDVAKQETLLEVQAAVEAVGPGTGPGAIEKEIEIRVSGQPVDGAEVWVSTDASGANVIAGTLTTDTDGKVRFMLDEGTYYAWVQKAKVNFTNPSEFTVTAPSE